MAAVLRISVSVDGILLTKECKPARRSIPNARIRSADELVLTIHPLIVGSDKGMTISGLSGEFLPEDSEWKLFSVKVIPTGKIVSRYRRNSIKAKRVSRPSLAGL
jgi:hypothetical protein